jgi:hypothetical protein
MNKSELKREGVRERRQAQRAMKTFTCCADIFKHLVALVDYPKKLLAHAHLFMEAEHIVKHTADGAASVSAVAAAAVFIVCTKERFLHSHAL